MTDCLTLKLSLPVESGEIVGGINTGDSVLTSPAHPASHDRHLRRRDSHVRAYPCVEDPEQSALLQ